MDGRKLEGGAYVGNVGRSLIRNKEMKANKVWARKESDMEWEAGSNHLLPGLSGASNPSSC